MSYLIEHRNIPGKYYLAQISNGIQRDLSHSSTEISPVSYYQTQILN
jgi:hypothetical protein